MVRSEKQSSSWSLLVEVADLPVEKQNQANDVKREKMRMTSKRTRKTLKIRKNVSAKESKTTRFDENSNSESIWPLLIGPLF